MKRLTYILLFSFYLLSQSLNAQVGDIKGAAGNSKGGFLSDGATSGDPILGLCCNDLFIDLFFDIIVFGGIELHKHYMDQQYDIPRVKSIEFMPQFAFNPPSTYSMLPRIRGNLGLFSTDIRYNFMLETSSINGADLYKTVDWQIIELNLVLTEAVNIRVGTGFMYEDFTDSYFNEHTGAVDFYLNDNALIIGSELRYAIEYESGFVPRTEGSLNLNYRIFNFNNLAGYANLGCLYQDYYHKVDVWSVQGGLNFKIQ
ncbi:MAG: hypothetical protein K9J13_01980 [Saprospiraceae bacterium]|nr:hypothetical protein [Saprospiraceae bacterium]